MSLREAAQQALEALEERYVGALRDKAMDALRTALAEPEQEPVAWKDTTYGNLHHQNFGGCIPLYTHPPQRKPLTDEEIDALPWTKNYESDVTLYEALREFARAIERAHGIGGEA